MIALVTKDLTCRLTGEKTWGREVGYCMTTNGIDINQAIIASGAALACPHYDDRYVRDSSGRTRWQHSRARPIA
jgi:endonuclease YncB( thermonuclease family)